VWRRNGGGAAGVHGVVLELRFCWLGILQAYRESSVASSLRVWRAQFESHALTLSLSRAAPRAAGEGTRSAFLRKGVAQSGAISVLAAGVRAARTSSAVKLGAYALCRARAIGKVASGASIALLNSHRRNCLRYTIETRPLTRGFSQRTHAVDEASSTVVEATDPGEALRTFASDTEVVSFHPASGRESIATVRRNDVLHLVRVYTE
jgi:hypothetical protein